MKQYILFTEEELDGMLHGEEIELRRNDGSIIYFMAQEHYDQSIKEKDNAQN